MLIGFNTATRIRNMRPARCAARSPSRRWSAERRFGEDLMLRSRPAAASIPAGCVAGAVGTRDRLLFTVYGDEVNIAARLEQLNK